MNEENSVKFASMSVQDHVLNVDSDWVVEVCSIWDNLRARRDIQSKMRDDITRLHSQNASHVLQVIFLKINWFNNFFFRF